ncbi:SMEK domain-containing protein [Chitinophaga sp.]|uniref:SMEK domain-containing protein n=1 Tax=Chitinophaga sp. TaxID=1869181 RepID=UPI0031D00947
MTNQEIETKDVLDRLAYWFLQLRLTNGITLFDGNKLAEPLVLKILNLLYGLDLIDLNDEKINTPGIDLGDKQAGVAFQVTIRTDADKVIETLRKASSHNFAGDYPNGIRFFVLNDGGKFKFGRIKPDSILASFDENRDIVYLEDVAKQVKRIYERDEAKFLELKAVVKKEIRYPQPEQTGPHIDTEALLNILRQELQKQGQPTPTASFTVSPDFEPDFSLPALSLVSGREETVKSYLATLHTAFVLWIDGSIGTGKTGLAYLVAKHFEPNVFWIDLRDNSESDFISLIVRQLCIHLGIEIQKSFKGTVLRLIGQLPKGALLILNDFPDINGEEKVKQHCSYFLQMLVQGGIKVVVTSNYQPYGDLEIALQQIVTRPAMPFSDQETGEVLRFYGATAAFVAENATIINTITDGHALLVNAAARYLQQHDWNMSEQAFMDIFKSNFGQQYTGEVYARIIDTTQDEETKTLLYRMGAVLGTFTDEEIGVVGTVGPSITNIHERSQQLKGFWLQELDKGSFQLSPLIRRLPDNLPEAHLLAVNVALGDHLLSKRMLSQLDASRALSYYLKGKAFAKLSWVLLNVLQQSLKNPSLFFDWGFQIFWYNSPLPPEIPTVFKVMIRSFHIQLSLDKGNDTTYLASDLEQLLETENVDPIASGFGYTVLSHLYMRKEPVKAMRYFLAARKGLMELNVRVPLGEATRYNWVDFIWTSFYSLRTAAQFRDWFTLFDAVKGELNLSELDTIAPYVAAAHSLVNVAVVNAGEDPKSALDTLQTVYTAAIKAELPLMAVYAIRYLISVQAHHFNDLEAAGQYIEANLNLITSTPVYTYLVREEFGRQLYYAGRKEEALAILSTVIEFELPPLFLEGVEGYRVYAELIGEKDNSVAHHYICKALDRVLADQTSGEMEKVKIQGETGISYWLIGDKQQAFYQLAAAYKRLLDNFAGTEEDQAAIIRLTHVANYIRGELIEGKAPAKTADDQEYVPPFRGLFYQNHARLLAGGFYFEERKFMGAAVFEEVFASMGDYTMSRTWALYGIEISLSLPESKYFPVLLKSLCYLIMDRQYIKAVNLYDYVEQRLQQIKNRLDAGEELDHFSEAKAHLAIENDAFLYQQLFIPIAVTIAHDIVTKKAPQTDYQPLIEDIFNTAASVVKDPDSLQFAKQLFENILITQLQQTELETLLSTYTGPYVSQMRAIAYVLQSINADAKQAARLHLSIVREFDATQQLNPPFYRFEVVPFLEDFWIQKFEQYPGQVESRTFWLDKSVPYFRNISLPQKVRALFKTIIHHTNVAPLPTIENWLDS